MTVAIPLAWLNRACPLVGCAAQDALGEGTVLLPCSSSFSYPGGEGGRE